MNRKVKVCPRAVGGQDLRGRAAQRERQAASVPKRQCSAAGQSTHRASQLGVLLENRRDPHSGCPEQLTDSADVDVRIDELADHLRQVRRSQDRRCELVLHDVGARFIVH